MAACRVCCQRQQVSGGQGAQTAEEQGAIFESGQRLDQPGAVITDRRQWNLGPQYSIKCCYPLKKKLCIHIVHYSLKSEI